MLRQTWIPACAGMTVIFLGMTESFVEMTEIFVGMTDTSADARHPHKSGDQYRSSKFRNKLQN